jgi:hypothetical protein
MFKITDDMLYKNEIGVCVDYGVAYLLEERNDENIITIIKSDDVLEEIGVHEKKLRKDHAFFKRIFDSIRDFESVSLFGPTSAKNEILQRIRANKLSHIKIENNSADEKITENQKIDFINRYFEAKSKLNR